MVLNYIWIAFFVIAFIFALIGLMMGDTTIFQKIVDSTFDSSKNAFKISLGLTGVLALWLGIMKIGEKAGVVNVLARALSPVFTRLFPDIPKNHPVMGSIFMNIASNMLGPLSGSGARGMMLEAMKNYGPDSFVGRLSCIFQGSTDTTFYILAVYFGSVSIRNTRHAVACGLLADLAGVIAAIAIAYIFF